eukprot:GHVH01016763.1.p1 GENE.GHVH01016763.1~~GHVH01016763.1.p1  ORF type:complete len:1283 (+),score=246.78 GHVH01016763.1:677-4525(+)
MSTFDSEARRTYKLFRKIGFRLIHVADLQVDLYIEVVLQISKPINVVYRFAKEDGVEECVTPQRRDQLQISYKQFGTSLLNSFSFRLSTIRVLRDAAYSWVGGENGCLAIAGSISLSAWKSIIVLWSMVRKPKKGPTERYEVAMPASNLIAGRSVIGKGVLTTTLPFPCDMVLGTLSNTYGMLANHPIYLTKDFIHVFVRVERISVVAPKQVLNFIDELRFHIGADFGSGYTIRTTPSLAFQDIMSIDENRRDSALQLQDAIVLPAIPIASCKSFGDLLDLLEVPIRVNVYGGSSKWNRRGIPLGASVFSFISHGETPKAGPVPPCTTVDRKKYGGGKTIAKKIDLVMHSIPFFGNEIETSLSVNLWLWPGKLFPSLNEVEMQSMNLSKEYWSEFETRRFFTRRTIEDCALQRIDMNVEKWERKMQVPPIPWIVEDQFGLRRPLTSYMTKLGRIPYLGNMWFDMMLLVHSFEISPSTDAKRGRDFEGIKRPMYQLIDLEAVSASGTCTDLHKSIMLASFLNNYEGCHEAFVGFCQGEKIVKPVTIVLSRHLTDENLIFIYLLDPSDLFSWIISSDSIPDFLDKRPIEDQQFDFWQDVPEETLEYFLNNPMPGQYSNLICIMSCTDLYMRVWKPDYSPLRFPTRFYKEIDWDLWDPSVWRSVLYPDTDPLSRPLSANATSQDYGLKPEHITRENSSGFDLFDGQVNPNKFDLETFSEQVLRSLEDQVESMRTKLNMNTQILTNIELHKGLDKLNRILIQERRENLMPRSDILDEVREELETVVPEKHVFHFESVYSGCCTHRTGMGSLGTAEALALKLIDRNSKMLINHSGTNTWLANSVIIHPLMNRMVAAFHVSLLIEKQVDGADKTVVEKIKNDGPLDALHLMVHCPTRDSKKFKRFISDDDVQSKLKSTTCQHGGIGEVFMITIISRKIVKEGPEFGQSLADLLSDYLQIERSGRLEIVAERTSDSARDFIFLLLQGQSDDDICSADVLVGFAVQFKAFPVLATFPSMTFHWETNSQPTSIRRSIQWPVCPYTMENYFELACHTDKARPVITVQQPRAVDPCLSRSEEEADQEWVSVWTGALPDTDDVVHVPPPLPPVVEEQEAAEQTTGMEETAKSDDGYDEYSQTEESESSTEGDSDGTDGDEGGGGIEDGDEEGGGGIEDGDEEGGGIEQEEEQDGDCHEGGEDDYRNVDLCFGASTSISPSTITPAYPPVDDRLSRLKMKSSFLDHHLLEAPLPYDQSDAVEASNRTLRSPKPSTSSSDASRSDSDDLLNAFLGI